MSEISQVLDIEGVTHWDSFKYLRVPIFNSKPKSSAWNPLVEKIKKRILGWGATWLNLAGKLVLIKAILHSYLLYQCSFLLAPPKTIAMIEGLLRSFLWQGGKNGGGKKFALISWKKIKLPRMEGGLQIRDLKTQNLVMGAKFLWNTVDSNPSWCNQVIKCKYFSGPRLQCLDNE